MTSVTVAISELSLIRFAQSPQALTPKRGSAPLSKKDLLSGRHNEKRRLKQLLSGLKERRYDRQHAKTATEVAVIVLHNLVLFFD
jgi:hypothetical protein